MGLQVVVRPLDSTTYLLKKNQNSSPAGLQLFVEPLDSTSYL